MSPVHVLDHFYLLLTLLVTIGYQLLGFAIAWTLQFDKITDFTGGMVVSLVGCLILLTAKSLLLKRVQFFPSSSLDLACWKHISCQKYCVLVMVWAARIAGIYPKSQQPLKLDVPLAGFLLFRVLKMGSDSRFDEIRSHFWKFFAFWIGQMLWIWTVSLALTILNSPGVSDLADGGSNPEFGTSRDIAGIVVWALGFVIESVADAQKYHYKAHKIVPKDQPTNRGLWAWSRHPSYFGEIMCWWGIWILCLSPTTNGHLPPSSRAAQYGSILSPIFTLVLLMFGSGVPTAEKPTAKRFFILSQGPNAREEHAVAWENYKDHLRKTSILIPLPPFLYGPLPSIIKKTVLLDFPFYQFDESTDGAAALEEAERHE